MYSQNLEEKVICKYFGDFTGTLLDCGSNDGRTFSNSRKLMLDGWKGYFFEPSSVCADLIKLYEDNSNAIIHHCGIGGYSRTEILHESGAHVANGNDRALVSTIIQQERARWSNVEFNPYEIQILGFKEWWGREQPTLDFISLDIEGMEVELLPTIDLTLVGCKCLCIEWNSKKELERRYTDYCAQHNMTEIHRNAENIIFAV